MWARSFFCECAQKALWTKQKWKKTANATQPTPDAMRPYWKEEKNLSAVYSFTHRRAIHEAADKVFCFFVFFVFKNSFINKRFFFFCKKSPEPRWASNARFLFEVVAPMEHQQQKNIYHVYTYIRLLLDFVALWRSGAENINFQFIFYRFFVFRERSIKIVPSNWWHKLDGSCLLRWAEDKLKFEKWESEPK